jgi:acetyl esterase/lipase
MSTPASLAVDDRFVPGPEGAPDVGVRVYAPRHQTAPIPAVLHIHGGGFCAGSVDALRRGLGLLPGRNLTRQSV